MTEPIPQWTDDDQNRLDEVIGEEMSRPASEADRTIEALWDGLWTIWGEGCWPNTDAVIVCVFNDVWSFAEDSSTNEDDHVAAVRWYRDNLPTLIESPDVVQVVLNGHGPAWERAVVLAAMLYDGIVVRNASHPEEIKCWLYAHPEVDERRGPEGTIRELMLRYV